MKQIEELLLAAAMITYAVTFLAGLKRKWSIYCQWILTAAILFQFASIVIRWVMIGHPPIFGNYEAALLGSWILALFVLFTLVSIHGHFRAMILSAIPMVLLILFYGLTFHTERKPLTLSERNLVVDFHALFSWIAYAPFSLAFSLSAIHLWLERKKGRVEKATSDHFSGFRQLDGALLDELSFRYISFGFINHTIMFALGSYYSSILYGVWWMWDPVESSSLIVWLLVALYIHLRLFYNWRAKKTSWLFIVIFITVIFSYWCLVFLPPGSTFHVFETETKTSH